MSLSEIRTSDLIEELKRREGIEVAVYEAGDKCEIVKCRDSEYSNESPHGKIMEGPGLTVLVVTD